MSKCDINKVARNICGAASSFPLKFWKLSRKSKYDCFSEAVVQRCSVKKMFLEIS